MERGRARRMAAVVMTAMVAAVSLAACAEDSAPTTTGPTTTTTTTAPATTTTASEPRTTLPPTDLCETDAIFQRADDILSQAGLAPGGPWTLETEAVPFTERTRSADEFMDLLALDCSVRAAQRTEDGAQRLLLAAWTDHRNGIVIQATDGPGQPFATTARFQLFIEEPLGEFLEDQQLWATQLSGGETILIAGHDTWIAGPAKSWWSEFPGFEDLPITIENERVAIDALRAVGARNVSVAEPARPGSEVAQVQFSTHRGLPLVAVIAPVGDFDPMEPFIEGTTSIESIRGVDVRVTIGDPDQYAVATVGWVCGERVWWFDAVFGTVEEHLEFVELLLAELDCR